MCCARFHTAPARSAPPSRAPRVRALQCAAPAARRHALCECRVKKVTLVLMTLDLYDLAEHATGGAPAPLNKYVAASLMPLMVLAGGAYRFFATSYRSVFGVVGIIGFMASCIIFGFVVHGAQHPARAATRLRRRSLAQASSRRSSTRPAPRPQTAPSCC